MRALSGLPFSRYDTLTTDSLVGLPNGSRLPTASTVDLLVRRPLRLGGTQGGIYLDVRNLLNRRNVVAVRRDTGEPQADDDAIDADGGRGLCGAPRGDPVRIVALPSHRPT